MATTATLISQQTLEAQVAGPGGATRLITITGLATIDFAVVAPSPGGGTATRQDSFVAHVGPTLTIAQFRKAIATASLGTVSAVGNATGHVWAITSVDADFDDEEGRVELQFDAQVQVQGPPMPATPVVVAIANVAFQVTILAA